MSYLNNYAEHSREGLIMIRFPLARNAGFVLTALVVNLILVVSDAGSQEATISEGRQTFRTYPFSDPDPVARIGNIYPYFRFQGYSLTSVMRPWKIVTLENPYLRVLVAPEIGGKILGAFEKSTGKAFIYFNRVVKFREIAMRGAWTSGGIEFNFGDLGHAPTTATPVDYLTRKNPDGSVSCIVGALDLASRTEWRVEIRLPHDRAYFETRAFWYNPTDLNTSRYNWMTAAADAGEDLQVIYPGKAFIGHAGETSPWPLDATGRDLSFYRNNDFGSYKSYHVLGSYTDFFGDDTASGVLSDYRTALRIAPDEWRTYSTLVDYFNQQEKFGEAAAFSREGAERFRGNYMLKFTHARTLLLNGDYTSSLAILDTLNILPFEGARYGRDTYRQACVLSAAEKISQNDHAAGMALLARSRLWPERLGAGKPYDVDSRLEDYLEAMESERMNNPGKARALLGDIARYSLEHRETGSTQHFVGALALRKLKREREAETFIDAWLKRDPGNPVARWSSFMFRNDRAHAYELEQTLHGGLLHRSTGDQDFVLMVDVAKKLNLQ
jgi:tetratricopeptide (TPR) repeat protein